MLSLDSFCTVNAFFLVIKENTKERKGKERERGRDRLGVGIENLAC